MTRVRQPKLIVIDPGHGGRDGGTTFGRQTEKAANLATALTLKAKLLEAGYDVELTRSADIYPSWPERCRPRGEVLFIAVHYNMPHSYACVYHQFRGGRSTGFAEILAAACGMPGDKIWSTTKSRFGRLYIDDVRALSVMWEVDAIDQYQDTADYRLSKVAPVVKAIKAYLER